MRKIRQYNSCMMINIMMINNSLPHAHIERIIFPRCKSRKSVGRKTNYSSLYILELNVPPTKDWLFDWDQLFFRNAKNGKGLEEKKNRVQRPR